MRDHRVEQDHIEAHEFQPVAGHPDDDECTYRADGSDATYCGLPEAAHGRDVVQVEQCRYMRAAYPTMDADETCWEGAHRHDEPTFGLARALAASSFPNPTDEQVAWFLDDAGAVIDDFDPPPATWTVTPVEVTREAGLDFTFTINGAEYVLQFNDSGGHVQTHPVSRKQWNQWKREAGDYCCPAGCGGGGCETCPCCCAGWCIGFADGDPWADALGFFKHFTPTPEPGSEVYEHHREQFETWANLCLTERGFDVVLPPAPEGGA